MAYQLYLVTWDNHNHCEVYHSMVVCATNPRNARSWHPTGVLMEQHKYDERLPPDWVAPSEVDTLQVTHLGTAAATLQPGVVHFSCR